MIRGLHIYDEYGSPNECSVYVYAFYDGLRYDDYGNKWQRRVLSDAPSPAHPRECLVTLQITKENRPGIVGKLKIN